MNCTLYNLNTIQYECTFHGYLPFGDLAGLKHVANVHNKPILVSNSNIDLFITNLLYCRSCDDSLCIVCPLLLV
jgi:hypothetical protein